MYRSARIQSAISSLIVAGIDPTKRSRQRAWRVVGMGVSQTVSRPLETRIRGVVVAVDAAMVGIALVATYSIRFGWVGIPSPTYVSNELAAVVFGVVWMLALSATETRRAKILGSGLEEYRRVLSASLHAFGALAILSYLTHAEVSRLFFAATLPLGAVLLLAGRLTIRTVLSSLRATGRATESTLVVGSGSDVRATLKDLRRNPAAGYRPNAVCLTDAADHPDHDGYEGLPLVPYDSLGSALSAQRFDAMIVAGGVSSSASRRFSWLLENTRTELFFVSRPMASGPRLSLHSRSGLDLIHVELPRFSGVKYLLKRSLDVSVSVVALVVFVPILALIALGIKLEDPGPVLFRQKRIGLKGQEFTIHKFRTMHVDAEKRLAELRAESTQAGPLFKMVEDPRVTRPGRVLRKYSLDELPQFWTVLRGHMSVVGPRPHLAHELAEFSDEGLRRLLIKPGITGLWQVSGRSDLTFEDAISLDLLYVENWSLTGDIAIILKTLRACLRPEGAY
jgi:exopolysaccharide biosynthesis polyprenyl glycosylphosphotransferase